MGRGLMSSAVLMFCFSSYHNFILITDSTTVLYQFQECKLNITLPTTDNPYNLLRRLQWHLPKLIQFFHRSSTSNAYITTL
ncbi:hypothetical protein KP509_25G025500 [Ceratopteris richardii]|uniref:Secreted protein n=1 Tax=Ceratopteris richardii TaxID=49495 RepID=A0A8T2RR77_CERRI|nr:hypothetical protein KP509_25G025500 [Ceratopteris richardii]